MLFAVVLTHATASCHSFTQNGRKDINKQKYNKKECESILVMLEKELFKQN